MFWFYFLFGLKHLFGVCLHWCFSCPCTYVHRLRLNKRVHAGFVLGNLYLHNLLFLSVVNICNFLISYVLCFLFWFETFVLCFVCVYTGVFLFCEYGHSFWGGPKIIQLRLHYNWFACDWRKKIIFFPHTKLFLFLIWFPLALWSFTTVMYQSQARGFCVLYCLWKYLTPQL